MTEFLCPNCNGRAGEFARWCSWCRAKLPSRTFVEPIDSTEPEDQPGDIRVLRGLVFAALAGGLALLVMHHDCAAEVCGKSQMLVALEPFFFFAFWFGAAVYSMIPLAFLFLFGLLLGLAHRFTALWGISAAVLLAVPWTILSCRYLSAGSSCLAGPFESQVREIGQTCIWFFVMAFAFFLSNARWSKDETA